MTVLITGGARSLGACIAELFASKGIDVIINYNNSYVDANNLKNKLEKEYDVRCLVCKADVSNEDEVRKMFDVIKNTFGNIDCVINNAGICKDNSLDSKTSEEFMDVIKVNLLGTYLVSKYSLDVMKKGCIINVASNNGFNGSYIESIDYDASKAGIINMTHNFAKYLSPDIRVNAICPGWIESDMTSNIDNCFKKSEIDKIMVGRFAKKEEIADAIYFMVNNEYVNDCVLKIDGGIK